MLTKTIEDKILARYIGIRPWPTLSWEELCHGYVGNIVTKRGVLKIKLVGLNFLEANSMSNTFSIINLAVVVVTFIDRDINGVVHALPPSWETFGSLLAIWENQPTFPQQLLEIFCKEEVGRGRRNYSSKEAIFVKTTFTGHGQRNYYGGQAHG